GIELASKRMNTGVGSLNAVNLRAETSSTESKLALSLQVTAKSVFANPCTAPPSLLVTTAGMETCAKAAVGRKLALAMIRMARTRTRSCLDIFNVAQDRSIDP